MDHSRLQNLVVECRALLETAQAELLAGSTDGAVGSFVEAERNRALAGRWGDEPLSECQAGVTTYLLASCENLESAVLLLGQSPTEWPIWSLDPLLRASAEGAARSWWVLDPSLDDRGRVIRWMNELIYSAKEYSKLAELVPLSAGPGKTLEDIYAGADAHNFQEYKNTGYLSELRPTSTDLFKSILSGPRYEWTFRALSAGPHSVAWSILGRFPLSLERWLGAPISEFRIMAAIAPLADVVQIFHMALERWMSLRDGDSQGRIAALDQWMALMDELWAGIADQ